MTLVAAAAGMAVNPGINYYRAQFLHFKKQVLLVSEFGKVGGISPDGSKSRTTERKIRSINQGEFVKNAQGNEVELLIETAEKIKPGGSTGVINPADDSGDLRAAVKGGGNKP